MDSSLQQAPCFSLQVQVHSHRTQKGFLPFPVLQPIKKGSGEPFLQPVTKPGLVQLHGAFFGQVDVPGEGLVQQVRGMAAALGLGLFEVITGLLLVAWVHAVLDDCLSSLAWRQTTQVGVALLGDDHVHVVVGVVHVGYERYDGGNCAVFRRGSSHKNGDAGVTGKVAGAADTVHHVGAADVGGVDVAVDVYFQRGVEGNDSKTTDQLRVVGDFLRAEHYLASVFFQILGQGINPLLGQGQSGTGSELDHAGVDQVAYAILQYFGSHYYIFKAGLLHAVKHSVGHRADTGL